MRVLDMIRGFSRTLADHRAARRRAAHFSCGDCACHDHCGRPPSEDCIERLEQMERYGDHPHPRPPAMSQLL